MYVWERQTGESDPAYAAFIEYRDQPRGHRSLRECAQSLQKSESLLSRWSSQWQWVARAAAFDEEQLKQLDETQITLIRQTNTQIHADAVMLRNRAIEALRNKDFGELTVEQLLLIYEIATKHDRAALGMDAGGGRGGNGNNGGPPRGGSGAPGFCKVYEGIDPSKV